MSDSDSENSDSAELSGTPLSEDIRTKLVKTAISTDEGWKVMARAILVSDNPDARKFCVEKLREIAGDKVITVPADNGELIEVNFGDVLVRQLEATIALLEVTGDNK